MSYAGPVSRGKRVASTATPDVHTPQRAPNERQASPGRPPARRAPSVTDDHRPTLIFAAGVAVGMAVGAGVALLLAPQAGSETRRAIGRTGRRTARRGRDAWDDLRDELRRALRRRKRARRDRHEHIDDPASLG